MSVERLIVLLFSYRVFFSSKEAYTPNPTIILHVFRKEVWGAAIFFTVSLISLLFLLFVSHQR